MFRNENTRERRRNDNYEPRRNEGNNRNWSASQRCSGDTSENRPMQDVVSLCTRDYQESFKDCGTSGGAVAGTPTTNIVGRQTSWNCTPCCNAIGQFQDPHCKLPSHCTGRSSSISIYSLLMIYTKYNINVQLWLSLNTNKLDTFISCFSSFYKCYKVLNLF